MLPFTRATILLGLLLMAAASGLVYWRRRAEINTWLRAQRRYVLVVEGVVLGLFALDLFIRWGNPDLWHPYYGGEKPMVFSFFNAVLKSTSFPPYNPWLAGYYLNYYYYGFVIVSIPVKLLGIVPAFAYNLILPTLFSMVGVNAFGVAYNLVAAARGGSGPLQGMGESKRSEAAEPSQKLEEAVPEPAVVGAGGGETSAPPLPPAANAPGNLLVASVTEPEFAGNGQAEPQAALAAATSDAGSNGATDEPASTVHAATGGSPASDVLSPTSHRETSQWDFPPPPAHSHRANPYLAGIAAALLVVVLGNLAQIHTFIDGFQKSADHTALANSALGDNDFSAAVNGFWRVATGQTTIALGTGSWYWDATRIIPILNKGGQEITEFPFFT